MFKKTQTINKTIRMKTTEIQPVKKLTLKIIAIQKEPEIPEKHDKVESTKQLVKYKLCPENYELIRRQYKSFGCILLTNPEDIVPEKSSLVFNCICSNPEPHSKGYGNFFRTPRCGVKKFKCCPKNNNILLDNLKQEVEEKSLEILEEERIKREEEQKEERRIESKENSKERAKVRREEREAGLPPLTKSIPFLVYKEYLAEKGYTLLTTEKEYTGCVKKNAAICPNGHNCKVIKSKLDRGGACKQCRLEARRTPFDDFKEFVESKGYTLLIKKEDYIGSNGVNPAICPRDHDCNVTKFGLDDGTCCKKCGDIQRNETNLKNFGGAPMKSEEVKQKYRETCMKKFGEEHPSRNPEVREKTRQTCMKNFGEEHPSRNPEVREKTRQTCIKNFGTDTPMQNEDVKQKFRDTCMKNFGEEHPSRNPEVREKTRQTCNANFGTDAPMQNEDVKQKFRDTCMEKFGEEHPSRNPEVREKTRQTCIKNFGYDSPFENPEIKAKIQERWDRDYGGHPMYNEEVKAKIQERWDRDYGGHPMYNEEIKAKVQEKWDRNYGGHPMYSEEVKQRMRETCIKKFGYPYAMQNPEVASKNRQSSFLRKSYEFPSGRVIYILGYEHFCINDLLDEGYCEYDIETTEDMPEIWYIFENQKHRYYPDIYIPCENKIIEIKSTYTFEKEEEINMLKGKACIDEGYEFEIRVYGRKGELLKVIEKF